MTTRPIFFDLETTGISSTKDFIVEIAAFDPFQDRVFEMLVNPGCLIPAEASAVHKITNEMVKDSPSFAEAGQKFIEFCSGDVVLIAHNGDAFDVPFIKNEFTRHKIPVPTWKYFDTLKWARRYRPDLPKHSLQFLREVYQLSANNAHRALDDVIILHQVYVHMTDDIDIETACSLLNKPRLLQHMPFGKYQGKPLKEVPKDYVLWMNSSGAFTKPENQDLKLAFTQLNLLTPTAA